ncbi:MAG: hypothetical protein EXS58_06185 [Candidatus Latescibacteria bacterium]|nr:hypothetical protein [Candidatus Latescibacterota bacterium]
MSYAWRNTLIMGVLLALLAAGGFYWTQVRQAGQVKKLQERERTLRAELDNANSVLALYDTTRAYLERQEERWSARTQVIPAVDSPAQTLDYLYQILKSPGSFVSFDLVYKGQKDEKGYSVNRYALEGVGHFEKLYSFIWRLEHGRHFYAVDHVEIEYVEPDSGMYTAAWEQVRFKMFMRAFFAPGQIEEALPGAPLSAEEAAPNPFLPSITQHLPENRSDFFEVEGARVKALTHDTAYLVDKKGRAHILREGDRVFMGRLAAIDIRRNRVWFVLNKGGIEERVALKAEFDAKR